MYRYIRAPFLLFWFLLCSCFFNDLTVFMHLNLVNRILQFFLLPPVHYEVFFPLYFTHIYIYISLIEYTWHLFFLFIDLKREFVCSSVCCNFLLYEHVSLCRLLDTQEFLGMRVWIHVCMWLFIFQTKYLQNHCPYS